LLTARGRLVLLLGAAVYLGAWAFGARTLYPVAVGFVLAAVLAWAWVRLLDKPMTLDRSTWGEEHVEGADVPVTLELEHEGPLRPWTLPVVERIARLGEREVTLKRGADGRLEGRFVLRSVPRGRYPFVSSHAILEDPFGLERTKITLGASGALLVYPRLVELGELFSESGAHAREGRRLMIRRESGFDLHSVRDYEQGESLRKVHWPSTARRGQLMVKDLEDAPRDEVAVLLDASEGYVAGTPPDSSFDVQVRAAGSILRTHVRRGRRAVLVVNGAERATQPVHAEDADWRRALELLAAVEPDGRMPPSALLTEDASAASRAVELVVVTAHLPPQLVDRLVHRALNRRGVSLVYVDPASFAVEGGTTRDPALLRLQGAGIPVSIIRRGDALASALGPQPLPEAVHG
jgi:uncharacterized protein (DUF58 family)